LSVERAAKAVANGITGALVLVPEDEFAFWEGAGYNSHEDQEDHWLLEEA